MGMIAYKFSTNGSQILCDKNSYAFGKRLIFFVCTFFHSVFSDPGYQTAVSTQDYVPTDSNGPEC
jgi:hypothetical protein